MRIGTSRQQTPTNRSVLVRTTLSGVHNDTKPTTGQQHIPTPDISPDSPRLCSQQERVQHIKAVCGRLKSGIKITSLVPSARNWADDRHRLVYCYMSKVACTAFKSLLLKANAPDPGARVKVYTLSVAELRRLHIVPFRQLTNKARLDKVQDYFTFMVTRHPFDRLISAWRDKVVHRNQSEFGSWPVLIFRHTRPWLFRNITKRSYQLDLQIALKHHPPTFSEFATWIAATGMDNEHWNTALGACSVCAHDWDAILRIETMETDQRIILDRLGENGKNVDRVPVRHSWQRNLRYFYPVKQLDLWQNVSDTAVQYFLEKYRLDMEIFGYQWDAETNTAVCSIQTANGTCC